MHHSCCSQKASLTIIGRRQPWRASLSLLLMICIGSYGCAPMQIPDYPKITAGSFRNATTKQDLSIAVRAMTDKKELEQYFGTDLSALKVLPVYVVAENRSLSTSFLLSKDNISLEHKVARDRIRQGSDSVAGESRGGTAVAVVGVATLSPLLLLAGAKAISDATVVKQNLASKALETRTVSPGKSVDGFVYFTLPDGKVPLLDWSISLHVKELGDSVHQFVFDLE
jgi:hypothetical protein